MSQDKNYVQLFSLYLKNKLAKLIVLVFSLLLIFFFGTKLYFHNNLKYKSEYMMLSETKTNNETIHFLVKIQSLNWFGKKNETDYRLFQDFISLVQTKIPANRMQRKFDRDQVIFFASDDIESEKVNLIAMFDELAKLQLESLIKTGEDFLPKKTNELLYLYVDEMHLGEVGFHNVLRKRHEIPEWKIDAYIAQKMADINSIKKNGIDFLPYKIKSTSEIPYQEMPGNTRIALASAIFGLLTAFLIFLLRFLHLFSSSVISKK